MKTTYRAEAAGTCPHAVAVKMARMAAVNKGGRAFISGYSKN